ncbi:MAG: hypothetical protein HDS92_01735 [Bacteroidales bacterium]|nr:hypothetical protein [Bacteroidales bacterium]MBD5377357.1 hypothetical protein [Bacteroides sp.]
MNYLLKIMFSVAMLLGVVHSASAHKNNILDGMYIGRLTLSFINDTCTVLEINKQEDASSIYSPIGKFYAEKLSDNYYKFVRIGEPESLEIETRTTGRSQSADSITVKMTLNENFPVPFFWYHSDGRYQQSDTTVMEFKVPGNLRSVDVNIVPDSQTDYGDGGSGTLDYTFQKNEENEYIKSIRETFNCKNHHNVAHPKVDAITILSSEWTFSPTSFNFHFPISEGMDMEVYAPNIDKVCQHTCLLDGVIFGYFVYSDDNYSIQFNSTGVQWFKPPEGVDFPYEWDYSEPKIPK